MMEDYAKAIEDLLAEVAALRERAAGADAEMAKIFLEAAAEAEGAAYDAMKNPDYLAWLTGRSAAQ